MCDCSSGTSTTLRSAVLWSFHSSLAPSLWLHNFKRSPSFCFDAPICLLIDRCCVSWTSCAPTRSFCLLAARCSPRAVLKTSISNAVTQLVVIESDTVFLPMTRCASVSVSYTFVCLRLNLLSFLFLIAHRHFVRYSFLKWFVCTTRVVEIQISTFFAFFFNIFLFINLLPVLFCSLMCFLFVLLCYITVVKQFSLLVRSALFN